MNLIFAKKGRAEKVQNYYLWLFHDEVERVVLDTSMGIANLFSHNQEFVGKGLFVQGASKTFRLLTHVDEPIDFAFFLRRIQKALSVRKVRGHFSWFRLIHGEGDLLPGVIADFYQGTLTIQLRHPVWEEYRSPLIDAFRSALADSLCGIYERSDFESSPEIGLKRHVGVLWGAPEHHQLFKEHELTFSAHLQKGQKTGFFLDQKDGRQFFNEYLRRADLKDSSGLDLFCYTGSFALYMAKWGIQSIGVDKSVEDILLAKENAKRNRLDSRVLFECADAFSWLDQDKRKYKVLFIDPPALVKSKNELFVGKRKMISLVTKAMERIDCPGLMGLCSCSYHFGWNEMEEVLRKSAFSTRKQVRVISQTIQSTDHPWLLQMPETLYLRCFWVEVDQD
jgi:23S rRNA (cytosine1962-C5)-methyltransferase